MYVTVVNLLSYLPTGKYLGTYQRIDVEFHSKTTKKMGFDVTSLQCFYKNTSINLRVKLTLSSYFEKYVRQDVRMEGCCPNLYSEIVAPRLAVSACYIHASFRLTFGF